MGSEVLGGFNEVVVHLLQGVVDGVYHERQEVVHHTEHERAFAQRQVEEVEQRHCGERAYQYVHPHGQDKQHHHRLRGVELPLAEDVSRRITQQQARQRRDDGYADGIYERVHRFRVHHELAEIGEGKRSVGIRKGVQHNQQ